MELNDFIEKFAEQFEETEKYEDKAFGKNQGLINKIAKYK